MPGHPADVLEKELAKFEAEAAPVLRAMRSTLEMPTGHDYVVLMNLVGLIAVRNPTFRHQLLDFEKRIFEHIADLLLSKKEIFEGQRQNMKEAGIKVNQSITYEQLKKVHDDGGFEIRIPEEGAIPAEFHGFDAILQHLGNRRWMLCIADDNSGHFICGDHPVSLERTNDTLGESRMRLGFGLRNTLVAFPVSKELVILGTFEGTPGRVRVKREFVADFNRCMISHANEAVFAASTEFEFAGPDDKIHPGCQLLAMVRKGEFSNEE